MHQTTIRFGTDLWRELSRAAEEQGTSVAQYVREAAVARMAHGAADDAAAAGAARMADTDRRRVAASGRPGAGHDAARGSDARGASRDQVEGSLAVWAQGRHARDRARAIREQSARIRAERPAPSDVVLRLREERLVRAAPVGGSGLPSAVRDHLVHGAPVHATAQRA